MMKERSVLILAGFVGFTIGILAGLGVALIMGLIK
jgi:hypothetical protein